MLEAIRNNAQGVFVWLIVGLIGISFALFGLGSYFSGASKVVAASVNGVDISSTELTRAYQNYQERLRKMLGEQYRPEMFGTARVKMDVLQGLITQEVLNQMMYEQGYMAASEQVFNKIKQYDAFQDDGKFSAKLYKEVLSSQRMNGEVFENDLSREIVSQDIRAGISTSAFLTDKEKKSLAALENQRREIGYFNISVKPYRKLIKISDDEVKSYYEKNQQLFLTDEKVQIEYVELKMDDVAALQEVSDEMAKQQYESSKGSYKIDDSKAVENKMASISTKLKNGASFSDLAKQYSHDKASSKQGGSLGYITRGIGEEFDKVLFALKKGEVSKVIKSKEGFQILKLEDIRAGDPEERKVSHILIKPEKKQQSFAEVKASIIKDLKLDKASKVFFDDADKMNNLSYETPDSLEPVADALGIKIKTSALMTRRGGAGLFAKPKIMSATFSNEVLKDGRNSELIELSDTHMVVLRIKKHQVASVQALDIVKSRVKNSLLKEQASKKVQKVASEILARLHNNETINAITKRYPETKWNKVGWITRKADNKAKLSVQLSEQLRQHAFAMPKPTADKISWDKVSLTAGDQAVVALYKVDASNKESSDSARITTVLGNADYESFVNYLKSQADISISQEAITAGN